MIDGAWLGQSERALTLRVDHHDRRLRTGHEELRAVTITAFHGGTGQFIDDLARLVRVDRSKSQLVKNVTTFVPKLLHGVLG